MPTAVWRASRFRRNIEPKKRFALRRPKRHSTRSGRLGPSRCPNPLIYKLPALFAAIQRGETIDLAEGELRVDALTTVGLAAACTYGSGVLRAASPGALRGATVVILADCNHVAERTRSTWRTAMRGNVVEGAPFGAPSTFWFRSGLCRLVTDADEAHGRTRGSIDLERRGRLVRDAQRRIACGDRTCGGIRSRALIARPARERRG
jgi:hypothetical protein